MSNISISLVPSTPSPSPPSPPSPTPSPPPPSPNLSSVPPISLFPDEESDPSGQLWQFSENDIESSSDIDDCNHNYPNLKALSTQELESLSPNDGASSGSLSPLSDILASLRKCRVVWRDHSGRYKADISSIVSPAEKDDDMLHVACRYGQLYPLRRLLEEPRDINRRNVLNKTPLHEAIEHGQIEAVRLLFEIGGEKVDVEALDPHGRSPLLLSAVHGFAAIFSELIRHGARRKTLWKGLTVSAVMKTEDMSIELPRQHAGRSKTKLGKKLMMLSRRIRRKRPKSPNMCVVCKKDKGSMKFMIACTSCKRISCADCIEYYGLSACCETPGLYQPLPLESDAALDSEDVICEGVICEDVLMSRRILKSQRHGRDTWRVSAQERCRLTVTPVRLLCRKLNDKAVMDSVPIDLCFLQPFSDSSTLQVNVGDGRYFRIDYESKQKCSDHFAKLNSLISERKLYLQNELEYSGGITPSEHVLLSDLVQICVRKEPTLPFEAPRSVELQLFEKHLAFDDRILALDRCWLQESDELSFELSTADGVSYEFYFANECMRLAWQSVVSQCLRRLKKTQRKHHEKMFAVHNPRGLRQKPLLSMLLPSTA